MNSTVSLIKAWLETPTLNICYLLFGFPFSSAHGSRLFVDIGRTEIEPGGMLAERPALTPSLGGPAVEPELWTKDSEIIGPSWFKLGDYSQACHLTGGRLENLCSFR